MGVEQETTRTDPDPRDQIRGMVPVLTLHPHGCAIGVILTLKGMEGLGSESVGRWLLGFDVMGERIVESFTVKCRKLGQAAGERNRLGAMAAAARLLNLSRICSNGWPG